MRKNSGVTLIALTITIIILLILATVIVGSIAVNFHEVQEGKDFSELRIVQQAVLQQYNKFLTIKNIDLLVGSKANTKAHNLAAEMEIELANIPEDTANADYYELTIDDLKQIGIKGAKNTYIVNYVTGEVMNAKKFTETNKPLYQTGRTVFTYNFSVGDKINYYPTGNTATYTVLDIHSGWTSSNGQQTFTRDSENNNAEWRVLDVKNGQIRLISEEPVLGGVGLVLSKTPGYNNAVKIIDSLCNALYSNTELATNVQNLKIEDIEEKLTQEVLDIVHASPYNTYPYTYQGKNFLHPQIWAEEIGTKIDGSLQNGTLGLSEQKSDQLIEGGLLTPTSITPYHTRWYKKMVEEDFLDSKYYEIFINNSSEQKYWLSSRCVDASDYFCAWFQVRFISNEAVSTVNMISSSNAFSIYNYKIRPVVTLNSGVKITGGNATDGWDIGI